MLHAYPTRDDLKRVHRILTRRRQDRRTIGVILTHRCARGSPQLSAGSKGRIQHALENTWADSTMMKYSSGLEAFHEFCDRENIPQRQRLPAGEELLCAFAAACTGEIAGGTARGAIAAIKAWHIIQDAQWNGGIRLRYTLKGVENLTPDHSRRDQRPPVTRAMVDMLQNTLDLADPTDAAVYAAACCAFWGQIRPGEILSETQGTYKAGCIPLVSDLSQPVTEAGTRVLRLPHTKTKGARSDDAILCRTR
ncbi:hypothetical protein C8R45DRAFT_1089004 [Mycena sanguinolenta]|nr:hypothetical protein C8R45DRAFT_1089004 [Mycena sanguinolenta]